MTAFTARLLFAFAVAGCAGPDAPIAQWAPGSGKDAAGMREEMCLPRDSELALPVFPGADIAWLEWPKKKPDCSLSVREAKGDVLLILMTKSSEQDVIDWYSSRLPDFRKSAHEGGIFFAKDGDVGLASKREDASGPTLWLGPPGELWMKRGYRTSIDIQYRQR